MKLEIENTSDEIREVAIRASLGDSWYMEKPDTSWHSTLAAVVGMIGVGFLVYVCWVALWATSLIVG